MIIIVVHVIFVCGVYVFGFGFIYTLYYVVGLFLVLLLVSNMVFEYLISDKRGLLGVLIYGCGALTFINITCWGRYCTFGVEN